jgi:predicted TIM-barrel fold metal-dependent hydrolase
MRIRLVKRKEVWRPTAAGGLLLAVLLLAGLRGIAPHLYGATAAGRPLDDAEYLVAEGWLKDHHAAATVDAFLAGEYCALIATGGAIEVGTPFTVDRDWAHFMVARLAALGVPADRMIAVAAAKTRRDRTYASAQALRRHFDEHGVAGARINLVTVGTHARRSALLFRRALGRGFDVGVIVLPDEFGAGDWWQSSEGFRSVVYEWLAWLYTLAFLFLSAAGSP